MYSSRPLLVVTNDTKIGFITLIPKPRTLAIGYSRRYLRKKYRTYTTYRFYWISSPRIINAAMNHDETRFRDRKAETFARSPARSYQARDKCRHWGRRRDVRRPH